jgi:hypothetical protein
MAILLSRDGTEVKGAGNVTELSAEDKKITNLADPTDDQDAATKAYVDAAAGEAGNALDGTFTIDNTADPTKQIAFDASGIATGTVRTISMPDEDVDLGLVSTAIQSSEKGAANGVAPLNALSKIDATYLPSYVDDVEEYANLAAFPVTGETGKIYVAIDTGFIYRWSGSAYVEINPSAVTSVNGEVGVVVLDTDDIDEGSSNLYYTQTRFDDAFAAKDTDDLDEGATNLYFTDARAKAAAVADAIADGVTDVAPSQNAVFDALALKADQDDLEVVEADSGKVFDAGVAGESFAANQVWLVRRDKSGETAGRYYKAQADSFANSRAVGFIVVGATGISAADPIKVFKLGEGALGSADTGFGAGNINAPVYLDQTTAGKFTLAPSTTSGAIIKPIGYVGNDLVLEFQPELAIQA